MAEKAIRHGGRLWAYEPEASSLSLRAGSWIVYRDTERGGRLRVGMLRSADEAGPQYLQVSYDDFEDIMLDEGDIVAVARPISSRSELRR